MQAAYAVMRIAMWVFLEQPQLKGTNEIATIQTPHGGQISGNFPKFPIVGVFGLPPLVRHTTKVDRPRHFTCLGKSMSYYLKTS